MPPWQAGLNLTPPRYRVQLPKKPREVGKLIIGIESARIGKNPNLGAADSFRLFADADASVAECILIRTNAEDSDDARAIPADLRCQAVGTGAQFLFHELRGVGRGAVDEIGDAVAVFQQLALFVRRKQSRREAGFVQRGPEAIAGAGEMVAHRARIKSRVDADE